MSENETSRPPKWFWVVAGIAAVWNLMGAGAYVGMVTVSEEELSKVSEAERMLYETMPVWVTSAFAIAVWSGVLGSIVLLFRKAIAYQIFIVSLAAILIQMFYNLFMSKAIEVNGASAAILPIVVILIAVFLVWFSKSSREKGWIS